MLIISDGRHEEIPASTVAAKEELLVRKGFVWFKLIGGITFTADPAWLGKTSWYVDVSNHPAVTAADINDLCDSCFPESPSGSIQKAKWYYIPTSGIVCIEQAWRI